jgi:hypothetical protein
MGYPRYMFVAGPLNKRENNDAGLQRRTNGAT